MDFEELVDAAHNELGVANMTDVVQLADRYGYPISEDMERKICRVVLETPEIKQILEKVIDEANGQGRIA